MKKNRFFWASAAIAALTLTACADQDEFNQNDVQTAAVENAPGAIQFGTYLGKTGTTRGEVAQSYTNGTITNNGTNPLTSARFGVFGFYTVTDKWTNGQTTYDPNFMYNQEIKYDNEATKKYWYYSPVKFWPNGIDLANADNDPSNTATETEEHKVSFFAYAPFASNVAGTSPAVWSAYPDDYSTSSPYGALPIDASTYDNYFKTSHYANATTDGGVIGMTYNGMKNDPWVNYVMKGHQSVATEAVDLLWGLRGQYTYDETDKNGNTINSLGAAYNTDLTKQSVPERVRFLFKHALAKVGGNIGSTSEEHASKIQQCGLKVVLDVDANSSNPGAGSDNQAEYQNTGYNASGTENENTTLVTIKKVSIQDGKSASEDGTNSVMDKKSDLNQWGWFDLATGQWKNQGYTDTGDGSVMRYSVSAESTATDDEYTLNEDIREPADKAAVDALLKTGTTYSWKQTTDGVKTTGVTLTAKNVYSDLDNQTTPESNDVPAIVMIPDNGTTAQTLYVTIDYIVRTADKQLAKGYSEVEQIISNEVKLKGLEANKYYTLVMHLGLTSVKFEAVVADWAGSAETQFDENGEELPAGTEEHRSVWLPSNVVNTTTIYADAGTTHKHVRVSDTANGYDIILKGTSGTITTPATDVAVAATSNGAAFTASASTGGVNTAATTYDSGTNTVHLTLYPNQTQYDIINTITITESTGAKTVVTLTQSKAEIILTPEVTSVPWNCGSIKVYATHPDGTAYSSTALNGKVTITPAQEGTISYSDGYFTFDPGDNTAAENRTITITATPYTGVTSQIMVVQAAATGTVDLVLACDVVTSEAYHIAKAGGESNKMSVKLNTADVTPTSVTTGVSWLTYNTSTEKFTATENTGAERRAVVTVTYVDVDGTHMSTITIIQEAGI